MRTTATKQPTKYSSQQKKKRNSVRSAYSSAWRSRSVSPLLTGMPLLQRKCACGGGCPRCKEDLGIQTKLKIGNPNDKYEQEADRIADQVMRMPEPSVQRQVEPDAVTSPQIQDILEPRNRPTPTATGRCYTCQIPGGIGICCYGEGAPIVPECFALAKKIIDNCKGDSRSCLQQAHCAQCQCIGRMRGEQYCQCTGIV